MSTAISIVLSLLMRAIEHPGVQAAVLKATRAATHQLIHAAGQYAKGAYARNQQHTKKGWSN